MMELLSKDHTILERPFMEFRPFGTNPDGTKIRDATGVKVRAFVDYLEEYMDRTRGPGSGEKATIELCRLLNERIPDPAYHVTPQFLKNIWHSYSYEFVCYLGEICKDLAGDPLLPSHAGEEKFISAVIQTLGRPFTLRQIYNAFPHFGEKFSCLILGVGYITDGKAILSMRYPASVYRQLGPYRNACAALVCQSATGALAAVPEKVHRAKRARIRDRQCVANGDECCEWEVTWDPQPASGLVRAIRALLLRNTASDIPTREVPVSDVIREENRRDVTRTQTTSHPTQAALLSKDHTILERPFMEFQPFGVDERGQKILDSSGVVVRANVEYLEECVGRQEGPEAAARIVQKLCALLNDRIRDSVYHVTPELLRNDWHSYSYEFTAYLREFCKQLSGDPRFHFNMAVDRIVPPLIQILGRPFPLQQIFRMYPHFGQKYAKGVVEFGVGEVTDRSAVLRQRFTERGLRQLGPYLKACAQNVCDQVKGGMCAVPEKIHGLPRATVRDLQCIVNGDGWCEWEFTWTPPAKRRWWCFWEKTAKSHMRVDEGLDAEPMWETPLEETETPSGITPGMQDAAASESPGPLSKEHTILERPFMKFRPFGIDEHGQMIRDVSGVPIASNVDYLEEYIATRTNDPQAGARGSGTLPAAQ